MIEKAIILIPVFNDEPSLGKLVSALEIQLASVPQTSFSLLVVDDGSHQGIARIESSIPSRVIRLHRNLGHQKALAIGLSYIRENLPCEKVIIMDTDGEDRPEEVPLLLKESAQSPGRIIFGMRGKRSEGPRFLFFYRLYKFVFRMLTGRKISFGNFMVMPRSALDRIVFYSEIWSHLAGAILKSGIPFLPVATERGKRYAGRSNMSFTRLLLHGLGSLSVFMEVIASRLLFFSFVLTALAIGGIIALVAIRLFTSLAIPGWTSTLISSLVIVLLLGFVLSLLTLFLFFSSESQRKFVPARHYLDHVGSIEKSDDGS